MAGGRWEAMEVYWGGTGGGRLSWCSSGGAGPHLPHHHHHISHHLLEAANAVLHGRVLRWGWQW
ncbi:UNVERIFIED_CONTAM: hypothetical protein Slati_4448700 [Sesamum latifolium]|uniref:Uncharacterized protein n=1 Tax=Sesamum latifolium TaxID=2727402 RepID=A0AAW2SQQ7_9LAMI